MPDDWDIEERAVWIVQVVTNSIPILGVGIRVTWEGPAHRPSFLLRLERDGKYAQSNIYSELVYRNDSNIVRHVSKKLLDYLNA